MIYIVKFQCACCGCHVDYNVSAQELYEATVHATSGFNFCVECESEVLVDPLAFCRVEEDSE